MPLMATAEVPVTLQPYFDKGILAYTQGSYEYAIDLLTFVVKQQPDATEARRYLRLAVQKQYSQSPPSWLSQAIACVVSLPIRWAAAFSAMQGQPRKAVQLYEQLLSLQPRSRSLLLQLASNLTRAGLDDAALTTYEELLSMFPNHLPTLRQFARLAMKRGGDQQARQCFERIIGIVPNDLEAQQGIRNLDALGTIKKGFAA
jgi:tetratricopeptide (TPR) repeat protein